MALLIVWVAVLLLVIPLDMVKAAPLMTKAPAVLL